MGCKGVDSWGGGRNYSKKKKKKCVKTHALTRVTNRFLKKSETSHQSLYEDKTSKLCVQSVWLMDHGYLAHPIFMGVLGDELHM